VRLELSADELQTLQEILEGELGDLREQIYKAEVAEYKAQLKERERIVTGLLSRLRAGAPAT
jgi:hypothetical protein